MSAKTAIEYGHLIAYKLAKDDLKYSQLRRFFDAIKELDTKENLEIRKEKLFLFQIQLVNGMARQKKLEPFVKVLLAIISRDWVKSNDDFRRLFDFLDAVVAFFNYFEQAEDKKQTQED